MENTEKGQRLDTFTQGLQRHLGAHPVGSTGVLPWGMQVFILKGKLMALDCGALNEDAYSLDAGTVSDGMLVGLETWLRRPVFHVGHIAAASPETPGAGGNVLSFPRFGDWLTLAANHWYRAKGSLQVHVVPFAADPEQQQWEIRVFENGHPHPDPNRLRFTDPQHALASAMETYNRIQPVIAIREKAPLECQLADCGWVISPNNIHGLDGVIMYPFGEGQLDVPSNCEVQVSKDRIRVFEAKLFGQQYTRKTWWDTYTHAVFTDVTQFMAWCAAFGKLSDPALPAFANSID